ncbi:MAG: polyhydroxyalkanoate synthesis repressor PhaR [Proteobacteria bacterium]|nr:polyhydroxyalkanoate synthesis repressor PhaR [Pseudomonadota bacterium]
MADTEGKADAPVTIKKYANRRLYNTATSSYVTLEYLCQMVKDNVDFVVFDAKSGEDITRSVLTQIIVEEEAKGQNLLPIDFLRQVIGCYGDAMQQTLLPRFLEHSMSTFMNNQTKMQETLRESFGNVFPIGSLDDLGRQNMNMFEKAMELFKPFGGGTGEKSAAAEPSKPAADDDKIEALTQKLDALQMQIDALSKK